MRTLGAVHRHAGWSLAVLACALAACARPALVSCPDGEVPCPHACVDLAADVENCGACGHTCGHGERCVGGRCSDELTACEIDHGGCSPYAACTELGGAVACTCNPGFTGTGQACEPCTSCDAAHYAAAPCTPTTDAVCAACSPPCETGSFEAQPCGPAADRVCQPCSGCASNQYVVATCQGTLDTTCAFCEVGCAACDGPGPSCLACEVGFELVAGACVAAVCSNGVVESGEACDDGGLEGEDGCSPQCQIEPGNYCFGVAPSICRLGSCVVEPATALPLGPDFALDGAGTASAAGLALAQRSTIYTTTDLYYPVLIEADVVYSGPDVTLVGTRGDGLRDATAADEPTDHFRARLSQVVELATGPGTTVIASTQTPFTPSTGVPYRVRFVDDGTFAHVEWYNLINPGEGVALAAPSSFHGRADRALVGGGDQAGVTISNVRVCSAPPLPVAGPAARYSAVPSWTVVRDDLDHVFQWQDTSGNARHLDGAGSSPVFAPGLLNGRLAGLDFTGAGLATAAFPLTTDVTVFAVIHHNTPDQWGAIAHHGDRDLDWSMEQSGLSGNSHVLHWQTNNDNTNLDLALAPNASYVLTGRFDGTARDFSATTFDGTTIPPVAIVDASHTIATGDKALYVGSSDIGEASNAFIGELVYFGRALTDQERDAMIVYLRGTWRP